MPRPTSLSEVRDRIDALDGELVGLLARRESLVRAAAAFKSDEQAVRAPDRAERVVAAARARAAASPRLATPSFASTFVTCTLTVFSLINRRWAIVRFVAPAASTS